MMQHLMKILEKIKSNSSYSSIFGLSVAVVLAKGITILFTPVISRLFGPEILGEYAILVSDFRIVEMIVVLGMNTLIIVTPDTNEAKSVFRLIQKSVLILCSILLLVFILLENEYTLFDIDVNYTVSLVLIYLLIITDCLMNACNAYANHQKDYKALMYMPIVCAAANVVCCLAFGILKFGTIGYTSATIISTLAGAVFILFFQNPFKGKLTDEYSPVRTLKKNIVYPKVQMPANLIAMLYAQLPVQIIGKMFSSVLLGSYSMCLKVFAILTQILSQPFNKIYLKEASDRQNANERIGEFSFSIMRNCAKVAIIPALLAVVFGKSILPIILGEKWQLAGLLISAVAIYCLVETISGSLANHYMIINRHGFQLFFSFLSLIVSIASLYAGIIMFDDFYWTILFFSLAQSLVLLVDLGVYFKMTGVKTRKYLSFVLTFFVLPAIFTIVLEVCR